VLFYPYEEDYDINSLKTTILEKKARQIVLTSKSWDEKTLLDLYDWCESNGIDIKYIPDIAQLCWGEVQMDSSLGMPIYQLKPVSLTGFNFYFKRVFDITVATLLLSFSWPVLLIVALWIIIDSKGHYFYRHKRVGYRGAQFQFYKFRTMVSNADDLLEKLKAKSDRKGPVFKLSNDPRVTKIGKFLRRYSIDEIPQLLNVLKGDMSLVGPRPQVLWEAAAYDDWAKRRLRVPPGITGLWQVSGRASLSYEEMIELDIYYIENWSIGLDLKILFSTIFAVIGKDGAY
jgi:exopolysaccharide biosynthesis polyprenyl glycosylphosphotransferase